MQQSEFRPPLRSARNLAPHQHDIVLRRVFKTRLRYFRLRSGRNGNLAPASAHRLGDQLMDCSIRIGWTQAHEARIHRHEQRIGEIVAMRNDAAASPPAHPIERGIPAADRLEFFKVAKRNRRPLPAINPKQWLTPAVAIGSRRSPCSTRRNAAGGRAGNRASQKAESRFGIFNFHSPVGNAYFAVPMSKVALGKGLGALINTRVASPTPAPEMGERVQQVSLSEIMPTPLQPRTVFRDEHLRGVGRLDSGTRHHPAADRPQAWRQIRTDRRRTPLAGRKGVGLTDAPDHHPRQRPIRTCSNSRSSKTSNARTSTRSKKRSPSRGSQRNSDSSRRTSRRRSARAAPQWRTACGCSICTAQSKAG